VAQHIFLQCSIHSELSYEAPLSETHSATFDLVKKAVKGHRYGLDEDTKAAVVPAGAQYVPCGRDPSFGSSVKHPPQCPLRLV
jgi:hypothetical protein